MNDASLQAEHARDRDTDRDADRVVEKISEISNSTPLNLNPPESTRRKKRNTLIGGVIAVLTVAVLVISVLSIAFDERRDALNQSTANRLDAIAQGKARVAMTWINGMESLGRRLSSSEYVRLFTYESALEKRYRQLTAPLAEQRTYMQSVIDEFARSDGLMAAALTGPNGEVLIASRGYFGVPVTETRVDGSSADGLAAGPVQQPIIGPVRDQNNRLVFDMFLPITAPQSLDPAIAAAHVGYIALTIDAAAPLLDLLRADALTQPGERHWMIIGAADPGDVNNAQLRSWQAVTLTSESPVLQSYSPSAPIGGGDQTLSFDRRAVFASSHPVGDLPWRMVSEVDRTEALKPLKEFQTGSLIVAGSLTFLFGFVLLALWWRQADQQSAALALQYRDLAGRINNHKQLLESVTGAIPDVIWLKSLDGPVIWANQALAAFTGTASGSVVGRTERDLFGAASVPAMADGDRLSVKGGQVRLDEQALMIQGERRIVNLSKIRLKNDDGDTVGLVGLLRDVTDIVAQRRRRERMVRQTVNSLIRAVELLDPHLIGHTRRVQSLTCDIAEQMNCSNDERATLELAAGLSQIGKIFIPRDLLTKPERHTDDEVKIMQSHIDHALTVVGDIDFDLPVYETLSQMYERLDGTGYPNRRRGNEISKLARVLAVCDVYCARTTPRSYREITEPAEVIAQLEANDGRYDETIVDALRTVVDDANKPRAAMAQAGQTVSGHIDLETDEAAAANADLDPSEAEPDSSDLTATADIESINADPVEAGSIILEPTDAPSLGMDAAVLEPAKLTSKASEPQPSKQPQASKQPQLSNQPKPSKNAAPKVTATDHAGEKMTDTARVKIGSKDA